VLKAKNGMSIPFKIRNIELIPTKRKRITVRKTLPAGNGNKRTNQNKKLIAAKVEMSKRKDNSMKLSQSVNPS